MMKLTELNRARAQIEQLAAKIKTELGRQQHDTPAKIATLYLFSKGYKSYQAARLLLREEFWQDAATIGRTVLELGFQARWLNLDLTNRAPLFVHHELRDRRKLLRGFSVSASKQVQEKAGATLVELDATVARVVGTNKAWRNWWADGSVEALVKEMGLGPWYDLLYRPLCWFVHSSPFGAAYYLSEDNYNVTFDCAPRAAASQNEDFAQILFTSLPIGFNEAIAAVDTAYELGHQPEFDRIQETLDAYCASSLEVSRKL